MRKTNYPVSRKGGEVASASGKADFAQARFPHPHVMDKVHFWVCPEREEPDGRQGRKTMARGIYSKMQECVLRFLLLSNRVFAGQ